MQRILALLLTVLLAGCGGEPRQASRLSLQDLSARGEALEPTWAVTLSPTVLAAIESGVVVTLVEQWHWLDRSGKSLARGQRRLILSHRVLTGNYLIHHPERDELRVFPGRSALLRGLRRTGVWPQAVPEDAVAVRVRLSLARTALPGSLRLQAVWSQAWRADSGWLERPLTSGVRV